MRRSTFYLAAILVLSTAVGCASPQTNVVAQPRNGERISERRAAPSTPSSTPTSELDAPTPTPPPGSDQLAPPPSSAADRTTLAQKAPEEPASPPVEMATDDVPQAARLAPRAEEPPTSAELLQPLQDQLLLGPMAHDWQKLNNCGPTTVAMALSYYGRSLTQADTAPVLKGGPRDKNVGPREIAAYLAGQGYGGIVRINGDIETLQKLVSNGIPVIVEQWLVIPGDELTGHYRLVRGYDREAREMIVNDSYKGPELHFTYERFDRLWQPFNRLYVPIYPPEKQPLVQAILGDDWHDDRMYRSAVETAQAEIQSEGDAHAWFNLGDSMMGLGEYARAAEAFDRAIEIGLPPRTLWYQFEPFAAYNQTGQFQRVLDLSAPLVGLALEEVHYQRGVAYEGLDNQPAALIEYRQAAELNPRFVEAAQAVSRLQQVGGG